MLKLIKYFEKIEQHYNINKDNFLIRGKLEDLDIFDAIDTFYVFIKSFNEINDILNKNNVNKKITFKVIKNKVNKKIIAKNMQDIVKILNKASFFFRC